jgi:hypothetical protein
MRVLIQGLRRENEPEEGRIIVSIQPIGNFQEMQRKIFKEIKRFYPNPAVSIDGIKFAHLEDIENCAEQQNNKVPANEDAWIPLKDLQIFLEKEIPKPLSVFISYSHKDVEMMESLRAHLSPLKRLEKIEPWSDQQILAGEHWNDRIMNELRQSDVILLLISADFIASQYIWEKELKIALERHEKKEARVIPVFLRDCHLDELPLQKLQITPQKNGRLIAIRSWPNQNYDEAYTKVVADILRSLENWTQNLES